jgi:hypothetical protein
MFEEIIKTQYSERTKLDENSVNIKKNGSITFGKNLREKFKEYFGFKVYVDRENKIIKLVKSNEPSSFKFLYNKKAQTEYSHKNSICASKLINKEKIEYGKYKAEIKDGDIYINYKTKEND